MLLKDQLNEYQIILASNSPRRYELLSDSGITFVRAENYEVKETYPPKMAFEDVPIYLSELKSKAYPEDLEDKQILITADTIVVLDGKIIGKPADSMEAVTMLASLSGQKHTVITGVTLRSKDRMRSFKSKTDVYFKMLSIEEIEYYVNTYQPYDKAGAYGIQEWIGYVAVERINGSFYNVMGLPVQKLCTELEDFIASVHDEG